MAAAAFKVVLHSLLLLIRKTVLRYVLMVNVEPIIIIFPSFASQFIY